MLHSFFNHTIRKPTNTAFQNTLTFYQYLFNSRINMHVNLVNWNSLHPKKAIIPIFQDKHQIFSVKTTKPELTTYTIRKLGTLQSFWAYGLGSNIYKKWCNIFYNAVVVEFTMYLARPPTHFHLNPRCTLKWAWGLIFRIEKNTQEKTCFKTFFFVKSLLLKHLLWFMVKIYFLTWESL